MERSAALSPFRHAEQYFSLLAFREARNLVPARGPVPALISWTVVDADGVPDDLAAGRGSLHFGGLCKTADDLHLRKWTGSCRGEGTGSRDCAWEGAKRLHVDVLLSGIVGFDGGVAVKL